MKELVRDPRLKGKDFIWKEDRKYFEALKRRALKNPDSEEKRHIIADLNRGIYLARTSKHSLKNGNNA